MYQQQRNEITPQTKGKHNKNFQGYPIDEPVLQAVMSVAQIQNLYPKMADFNKAINLNSISKKAIFLILRSASLDNIHKGMKYGVWTSTPKSNARIDELFKESEDVYLIYSVVGTKAFQACAKLLGPFDPTASFLYWDEPLKWFGSFQIKCLFLNELKQKTLDEKQPAHLGSIVLTEQTDCTEITNGLGLFVLQCFKDQQEDETNVNVLLQQFQNMDRREEQIKQQRDLDQNFLTQQSHEQQLFEKSPFEYKNYHKRQNQQRWQSKQADQMMYGKCKKNISIHARYLKNIVFSQPIILLINNMQVNSIKVKINKCISNIYFDIKETITNNSTTIMIINIIILNNNNSINKTITNSNMDMTNSNIIKILIIKDNHKNIKRNIIITINKIIIIIKIITNKIIISKIIIIKATTKNIKNIMMNRLQITKTNSVEL